MSVIFCLLAAHHLNAENVGVVIGGYGGGNSLEIVTGSNVCMQMDSNPTLPNAPAGQLVGWVAEYIDGLVYLCGGQDSNIHKVYFFPNVARAVCHLNSIT